MDEKETIEPHPLLRWVTIPLGLILVPISIICVMVSASVLIALNNPLSFSIVSIGSVLLGVSFCAVNLAFHFLFFNTKKSSSKFITPLWLRFVATVLAMIPAVSILLGTFWEQPFIHSIMSIAYMGIIRRLLSIAKIQSSNA